MRILIGTTDPSKVKRFEENIMLGEYRQRLIHLLAEGLGLQKR